MIGSDEFIRSQMPGVCRNLVWFLCFLGVFSPRSLAWRSKASPDEVSLGGRHGKP